MKAGKALGTVLLILGALTLLAGLLAITLPMMPFEPVQRTLNGLRTHSDTSAGKMLLWLLENGWLTLGIGVGLIALGTVLRGICARAVRNRARREAEERRNSLMEQKQNDVRQSAAVAAVQDRYAAAAGIPPVPVPRQDSYVSPVPTASNQSPVQQRKTINPLAEQIDSMRMSLYEQNRMQQPQHREPSDVIHSSPFESTKSSPVLERTGKNPYVRPLFPQSEWEIVEKGLEKPRNPYARPKNLTTLVLNEWEALEKALPNRTTDYYSTHQMVLYADHVAGQQSNQQQTAESLKQRMSAALPEVAKDEMPLTAEKQGYMGPHNPEWNQPTDLTAVEAWNTSEMPVQTVWEARGVFSSENVSEPASESRLETFVKETAAEKEKEVPSSQERASETVPEDEMPAIRSRMGRRAARERESMPVDEAESKELLTPASSRIKLTIGKHTSEK